MDAFLVALGIIFIAELGDKTQLLALALAARYDTKRVLLGVFVGTFAVNFVSVAVGEVIGMAIPSEWIAIIAAVAFLGVGVWLLFDDDDEEDSAVRDRPHVVFSVAVTIFLAELGDKTMLAAMTVASHQQQLIPVWLGASTGMFAANAIAVLIGRLLGKSLPERPIKIIGALVFFGTGTWILVSTFV